MKICPVFFVGLMVACLAGCNNSNSSGEIDVEAADNTPLINYAITNTYPHDVHLFTEGLLFHNGQLFESTGSPGDLPQARSLIVEDSVASGRYIIKDTLNSKVYFGEGICFFKNKLYELTYKNQLCFIYDAKTFKLLDSVHYANAEGWALTADSNHIIMSDGTDTLTYIDPAGFAPVKTLAVTENNAPLRDINELEYINGFIYADVWKTNNIVKIDTGSGKVVGKLNLTSLVLEAGNKNPDADVLNGIAYNAATNTMYVTGKLWANIYELQFAH